MNDIKKNTRFNTDKENTSENYEFPSDLTLTNLLNKVGISEKQRPKKLQKNASPPDAAIGYFKSHPRYITEDSLFSIDNHYDDNLINRRTENSILNQFNNNKHETAEETTHYARLLPICKNFLDMNEILDEKPNLQTNENNIKETTETEEFKKNIKKFPSDVPDNTMGVNIIEILIKIENWIQKTRSAIKTDIVPIEGDEDMSRREKRGIEFSARFSRNYLYQLSRQLTDMRKYVNQSDSPQKNRSVVPPPTWVITNSCQIVLRAIQAYCKYVPTAAVCSPVHEKFLELIRSTLELCIILRRLATYYHDIKSAFTSVEDVETNVLLLEIVVKQHILTNSKPVPKPEPKLVKQTMQQRKKSEVSNNLAVPFHKQQPLAQRLSMYTVSLNRGTVAQSRLNVQSRYKAAAVANKLEKHQNVRLPPLKVRATERKLSVASSFDRPICNIDEDISTMVQVTDKKAGTIVDQIIRSRLEPVVQDIEKEVAANKQLISNKSTGAIKKKRQYLEYGEHNGHLYGTHLDTIRGVTRRGKMCVLDCSPSALKTLHNSAEFLPYVIFIAAPDMDLLKTMYSGPARSSSRDLTFNRQSSIRYSSRRARTLESLASLYEEDDLRRTVEESARLQRAYEKYVDLVIVNEDFDVTFRKVVEALLDALAQEHQWVPVNWIY